MDVVVVVVVVVGGGDAYILIHQTRLSYATVTKDDDLHDMLEEMVMRSRGKCTFNSTFFLEDMFGGLSAGERWERGEGSQGRVGGWEGGSSSCADNGRLGLRCSG